MVCFELSLLDCGKRFEWDNGLVEVGVEAPIHGAIVFDLDSAGANGFLKKHMACIFFIEEQFADCLPVPLGAPTSERMPCFSGPTEVLRKLFPNLYCPKIQMTASLFEVRSFLVSSLIESCPWFAFDNLAVHLKLCSKTDIIQT